MKRVLQILAVLISIPVAVFLFYTAAGAWTWWRNSDEILTRLDTLDRVILGGTADAPAWFNEKSDLLTPTLLTKRYVHENPTRLFDVSGQLVGEYEMRNRKFLRDVHEMPPFFIKALLATEDRNFFSHHGFRLRSILRASLANFKAGRRVQGGSTLTQQLAKILFTTREKTFSRKFYELFCAFSIEKRFSKQQILVLYLNLVYFGHGQNGVNNIAAELFSKSARHLSLMEGSHLVAMLANPTLYSPFQDPDLSRRRHAHVLSSLIDLKLVPEGYARREMETYWHRWSGSKLAERLSLRPMSVNRSPYVCESSRRFLEKNFTEDLFEGDVNITLTVDLEMQRLAEQMLSMNIAQLSRRSNYPAHLEGAMICIDEKTGGVLALAGGSGFSLSNQLIRTEQMRRSVGSLGKPFIYAFAIENLAYTPKTILEDKPIKIRIPSGIWEPRNYDRKYLKEVPLEKALLGSRNVPAVNTVRKFSLKDFHSFLAAAYGVETSRIPASMALALGAYEMSPVEIAAAFLSLSHDGRPMKPHLVQRISAKDGSITYEHTPEETESAIKPETTEALKKMLYKVITEPAGTAHDAARMTGFYLKAWGKTGTSQDYKDAWFAGSTAGMTCIVWIGADDNTPMPEGTGGMVAAPLWMDYFKALHERRPYLWDN